MPNISPPPPLQSATALEDWGVVHVVVDGTDVTFLRGRQATGLTYGSSVPAGDLAATFTLPGVTVFDDPETEFSWLQDGAPVDLVLYDADGVALSRRALFEGVIEEWSVGHTEDNIEGLVVVCKGALRQLDDYIRMPAYRTFPVSTADALVGQFNRGSRPALTTSAARVEGDASAFTTVETGAADPVLSGYIIGTLLPTMLEADGTKWTLDHDAGRTPVLRQQDLTTVHWSVSAAAHGVSPSLTRPYTTRAGALYGEGQDAAQAVWRRSTITDLPGGETHTSYTPLGLRDVHDSGDAAYDPNLPRRERFVTFPPGTELDDAIVVAQRLVEREADPGWTGTVTLTTDPEEGSRFDIRAGENLRLRHVLGLGDAGLVVHIIDVQHDLDGLQTSITFDTKGRFYDELEAAIAGQRGNTIGRRNETGTLSGTVANMSPRWDIKAGMGWAPRAGASGDTISVSAGAWKIVTIAVPTSSEVPRFEARVLTASGGSTLKAVPFHISLYSGEISASGLPADPLAAGAFNRTAEGGNPKPWENLLIRGWGENGDAAGYWPGSQVDGDSATGVLVDETSWSFSLDRGATLIWAAIWVPAGGHVRARIFPGVQGIA